MVSAENIVSGGGNFHVYVEIADAAYTFAPGDQFEYDILLPALNPVLRGGVDAGLDEESMPTELAGRSALRDCGLRDQEGIALHGNGLLNPARDTRYRRRFDLSKLAGCTVVRWPAVFEGDEPGRYIQFLDNIRIVRDGEPVFSIYEDGPPPPIEIRLVNDYSREGLITTAPRGGTMEEAGRVALNGRILTAEFKPYEIRTFRVRR